MTDSPLDDSRFPNRPNTPDFWRMAETVLKLDGRSADDSLTDEQKIGGDVVDIDSLTYMAEQRVMAMLTHLGVPQAVWSGLMPAMTALYATSFIHGIEFEKSGGHRT